MPVLLPSSEPKYFLNPSRALTQGVLQFARPLHERLGPIFTTWLLGEKVVVVGSYDLVKKCLSLEHELLEGKPAAGNAPGHTAIYIGLLLWASSFPHSRHVSVSVLRAARAEPAWEQTEKWQEGFLLCRRLAEVDTSALGPAFCVHYNGGCSPSHAQGNPLLQGRPNVAWCIYHVMHLAVMMSPRGKKHFMSFSSDMLATGLVCSFRSCSTQLSRQRLWPNLCRKWWASPSAAARRG